MNSSKNSSITSSRTASKPGEGIRLNRWLAECGICSRREADTLIKNGQVGVNGEICTDLSRRVDPERDSVTFKGKKIGRPAEKLYLMLNKPPGYVVSRSDEFERKTIYDLLPDNASNLRYAGRLDKNSEGLLLITNDGDLINLLTHPSHGVEKVYRADINRRLGKKELENLRQGVRIAGGMTRSAGVYVRNTGENSMTLKIIIKEGRKRQVRRMLEAVGARVVHLKRLQFGPLCLKDLPSGRWRPLTQAEVRALKHIAEKPKP